MPRCGHTRTRLLRLLQDDEQELLTVGVDQDVAPAANEPFMEAAGEEIKGPRLSRTLSLWDGTIPRGDFVDLDQASESARYERQQQRRDR